MDTSDSEHNVNVLEDEEEMKIEIDSIDESDVDVEEESLDEDKSELDMDEVAELVWDRENTI